MFSCRAAWQRCGPLARTAAFNLPRNGLQRRQMSSMPGGSGENIVYAVLCGGAFVGAVTYVYKTVSTDNARYKDRIEEISARSKEQWVPKPCPPQSKNDDEDGPEEEAAEDASQEGGGDAAAESETETEAVVEIVAEVAVVAEEVAEAAQEVQADADEVPQVVEDVEETAHAIAEQVAAEDPESNGMTSSSNEDTATSEA